MPSMEFSSRTIQEWINRMSEVSPSYGYYPSSPRRRTPRVGSIDYYKMKYWAIIKDVYQLNPGLYVFITRIKGPNNHNFSQNKKVNEEKKRMYEELKVSKPLGVVFRFVDKENNLIEEV